MTNTTTSSPSTPSTAPVPGDPRHAFAIAVETVRGVVDGITPEQMTLPTVCDLHDVRSLLGHSLIVLRRLAALGNGTDPMDMPDAVTGVADGDWPAAYLAEAHEVQKAWTDPAKLAHEMVLPWATAPGAAMVAMYTAELTVHTWDLATATGLHVDFDPTVVDVALDSALRALPSGDREAFFREQAEAMGMPHLATHPPFKNPVEPGDGASALARLLGWYGRQPIAA